MRLRDKVVLITGASGGIGEAIALAFDREGARIALSGRRKEKLESLASMLHDAIVLPADLTDPDQPAELVHNVIRHFGKIDILINNAALIIVSPASEVSSIDLQRAFSANLLAPVKMSQELFPVMQRTGGGHIINIGSPGFKMGIPFYAPYVCSKAALSAWTRTVQAEWAGSGVYVSEYFPGYVWTESRAESRIGNVDQDFLMATKQNFISGIFTRPQQPGTVAKQIIKLALHPRPLVYSSWKVKLGDYLSNIPGFRLTMAKQMVRNAREKISNL